MKVLIDSMIPFVEGVFEPYAQVSYKEGSDICRNDVLDADALITRTRTKCDAALLEGTKVSFIATATAGTPNIDKEFCFSHGIEVVNAFGSNSRGVMQYVFSALYGVASRKGIKLDEATIGIVGVGESGRKIESLSRKLGFKVLLYDPLRAAIEGEDGFCTLDHLASSSDIITFHIPVTPSTEGIADEHFFSLVKPGAIFINVSNGELVDEKALVMASPKLGALIIDAWRNEPDINRELMELADIATPHIAGYSLQSKSRGSAMAVQAVARHFGIRELFDYYPDTSDKEHEPLEIDLSGKNQGEIASVLQYNYPVFTDDFIFRMEPHQFNSIRANYQYRREIIIK